MDKCYALLINHSERDEPGVMTLVKRREKNITVWELNLAFRYLKSHEDYLDKAAGSRAFEKLRIAWVRVFMKSTTDLDRAFPMYRVAWTSESV
jgi:hypothetical protein